MANTQIQTGQLLTARCIVDSDITYSALVIERKGSFATINIDHETRRVKVRTDYNGNEYLRPDNYSMAPIYS